jgi:hypothetical protein
VALEEGEHALLLVLGKVGLLRVGAERHHLPADVDRAAGHVLADLLAGVAQYHQAPAVHHVAGHEVGVAGAAERALLHHLAGPGADVPVHDDLGAADCHARDGARVSPHDDGAAEHVVGETPADVAVDLEARPVGEACAEVAGRAVDLDGDRRREPDADVVARVRVQDLDVLALRAVAAQELVRLGDPDRG